MASTANSVEVNQVYIVNRLRCDFSYPFAEALGTVVTFLLAFMADGFFCRTGATRVWALSTPGTLLLGPPLCCTCFVSVAAASPVGVDVAHRRLS